MATRKILNVNKVGKTNPVEEKTSEKISFNKIQAETEGSYEAQAVSVEVISDKDVKIGTNTTKRDVLKVEFLLENGNRKTKEMILAMTEDSDLGKFVEAVKGHIPNRIENFEEELLNRELIVDIGANIKGEKTYYNITGFHYINSQENPDEYNNEELEEDPEDE